MAKRTLAFDIGIKNLAWCCADTNASKVSVKGWANENLISGGTAESDKEANKCESCTKKSSFSSGNKSYCVKHCPPLTPALRDLSGCILKKIPAVAVLKQLAIRHDAKKEDLKTKVSLLAFLEKHYAFPKIATVVKKVELEALHDGMRKLVLANSVLFSSCNEILLENQPVYKNPVMKSVQMMLFATLRDLVPSCPKLRLVHAGRKTEGATKGDDGYAERKNASELRVLKGFEKGDITFENHTTDWFSKQSKRSDLADCLCMVMDSATQCVKNTT